MTGTAIADNLYIISESEGKLYEIEYNLETIDAGGFICGEIELLTPIKTLKKNDFKREQNKERDELVRELEALNPDQLEKLRTIKL